MSEEHTRTGAWLPGGRTLADLAGERCLVKPSRAPEMPIIQFRVVEVSPSREHVRVEGSARHEWLRAQDYTVIEVLEPWADNERALAQLHGLLGTADVRAVRDMIGVLLQFAPAETQASIERACPKLGRTPNAELQTASAGEKSESRADKVAQAACTCPAITCAVHCWPGKPACTCPEITCEVHCYP